MTCFPHCLAAQAETETGEEQRIASKSQSLPPGEGQESSGEGSGEQSQSVTEEEGHDSSGAGSEDQVPGEGGGQESPGDKDLEAKQNELKEEEIENETGVR